MSPYWVPGWEGPYDLLYCPVEPLSTLFACNGPLLRPHPHLHFVYLLICNISLTIYGPILEPGTKASQTLPLKKLVFGHKAETYEQVQE